jgi:hypothetical protein
VPGRSHSLVAVAEPTSYQGGSVFLRWWPSVVLGLAVALVFLGGLRPIQWEVLLVVVAYIHFRWLPWQFTIRDEGLVLTFPFGRKLFIPKASLTVRIETVGATALVGRHRRFGYLLLDRLGYEPGRSILLHTAFSGLGYELK